MMERTMRSIASMGIVLMLALCPLLVAMDGDAVADEEYTIEMRTGDMFTYRPVTNLESKIEATALNGMTFEDGVMTASFDKVDLTGNLATLVSATWTSDVSDVKQVATQYIVFKVHPHVAIDGSFAPVAAAMSGAAAGTVLYKPVVSEASEGTVTEVTCSVMDNDYVGWDSDKKQVYLKKAVPEGMAPSEMTLAITAANKPVDSASTLQTESVSVSLTVTVGGGLAIISDDVLEMKKSEADTAKLTYTVKTNADQDSSGGLQVTGYSFDTLSLPSGMVKEIGSNGSITFDPSVVEFPEGAQGDDAVKEFSFDVTVTAKSGDAVLELTRTVALKVYADIVYTTLPSLSDVSVNVAPSDAKTVLVSAKIGDAKSVSVDWGDKKSLKENISEGSESFNRSHTYDKAGTYWIVVEATNDAGSKCCYVKYDAATGAFDVTYDKPVPEEEQKEHSWIWMVFLALAVLLAVAFFLVAPSWYVLIGSAVCAVLAVIAYIVW